VTLDPVTILLASLFVLACVFAAFAYWLSRKPRKLSKRVLLREGEAWMGRYLRDHQPRTTVHTLVNRLTAKPIVWFISSLLSREEFPDVSYWQGDIDWHKMREKARKVIIRAGQGIWTDIRFIWNWIEARKVGFSRGVYFFYDGRVSPGKQAALLVSLIKDDLPELGVWIDWEKNFGGAYEGLRNVVAMMQEIERLLPGAEVGVYTGYYFFIENSNPIWNAAQYSYLAAKKLWLAFYAILQNVLIPKPWLSMKYWQKGTPARGKEFGVETGDIDMNEDMDSGAPPPPTGGNDMIYNLTVLVSTLYIRAGAGTNYAIIGSLHSGDKVISTLRSQLPDGSMWYRLDGGNVLASVVGGWSSAGATGGYMRLDSAVEPPVPVDIKRVVNLNVNAEYIETDAQGVAKKWGAMVVVENVELTPK